jgi:gliding motility-associated-like protein
MKNLSLFTLHIVLWITFLVKTNAQTFDGAAPLNFPPTGTIGITQSTNPVSGIGVIGGCTYIDNVTMDITHTWVGETGILLIAPNGTFIELSTGNGGSGDDFSNTVFSDAAVANIVTGTPPFSGTWKPEGRQNFTITNPYPNTGSPGTHTFANTFNGINADGTWTLYLNDYAPIDAGILNSWSITFVNGGTSFTVDAGPNLNVCTGDDVTLTATNTAPSPTGYSWSNGLNTQTININNISNSGTFTVTVTDQSGCTATDVVQINVSPTPVASPATLILCEISGTGQALFNLTSLNSTIGTGTVAYYQDANATMPISNPANYLSGSTTVYATVSNGTCTSDPVTVTLTVTPSNPSLFDMEIVQSSICGCNQFTVLFTLPNPGVVYTYAYILSCGTNIQNSTVTTSANPIFFSSCVDCTLEILSITQQSNNCTTTFSPPLTDQITVAQPPQINVTNMQICAGDNINLSDFVTTDPNATLTFHTGNPPTTGNQLSSTTVSPSVTTTYFANASISNCSDVENVTVTVNPGGPTFNTSISICENSNVINLNPYITPNNLTGVWTGTGVTGNTFDPNNLSGTITLTFTPTNPCYDDGTLDITINEDLTLNLLTANICSSDAPLDLNTLEDPNVTNGNWSGSGVSNNLLNPENLSGSIVLVFTPTDPCISPATTTVNISTGPQPDIENNIVVCQGTLVDLNDYVNNLSGNTAEYFFNLPAIPANLIPQGSVLVNGSATYYVQLIDNDGCFQISPISIMASPGGLPTLGTATLCQTQNTFNLTTLNDPLAGNGQWSGPGVAANVLDLSLQTGNIQLTFEPSNACFSTATTFVDILAPQDPNLSIATICSGGGNYNLINLADPNFIQGVWTGQNVVNNVINPSNISGIITLQFQSSEFCVNAASTTLEVIATVTPSLQNATVCETTDIIDLNNLLDPLYNSGQWSGTGVNGTIFETQGLIGTYPITFTSDEQCILPVITAIEVNALQTPTLLTIATCETNSVLNLSSFVDPLFPTGTWSGPGVQNGFFNPEGLQGTSLLEFLSNTSCTLLSTTSATVLSSPEINNLKVECSNQKESYIVTFDIASGDPNTYLVNGVPSGSTYTSAIFPSGQEYNLVISDGNNCGNIVLQGSKKCDCLVSSGTMLASNTPMMTCKNDTVRVTFNNNAVLGSEDKLLFVLHDKPGLQLGKIFSFSNTPTFGFPSNGTLGTTYYISAIAADSIGRDSIDFADPCFSVAAGVPVIFYEPNIQQNPITNTCINNCTDFSFNLSGQGPFKLITGINYNNQIIKKDTIFTTEKIWSQRFCPDDFDISAGTYSVSIIAFEDKSCNGNILTNEQTFTIFPERVLKIEQELCQGESIVVNNNTYNQQNPTGTETISAVSDFQCDSIITINLSFKKESINNLNLQLCENQSISVNNKIYNINNATGTEIIKSGSSIGCDSIIVVNLVFAKEVVTNLNPILCDGESITINGTVYNKNNSTGTEKLSSSGMFDCDTIINVNVSFLPKNVNNINAVICENDSILVNGKYYSSRLPSGSELITSGSVNGCDSIINVSLNVLPNTLGFINDTLCQGQSVVYNGIVFDENLKEQQIILVSSKGCDSILNVRLEFYPQKTDTAIFNITKGEKIEFLGTTFNENNPFGLVKSDQIDPNGCPQFVYVTVNVQQEILTAAIEINDEICPGAADGEITIKSVQGCKNYTISIGNEIFKNVVFPFTIKNVKPNLYNVTITGDVDCKWEQRVEVKSSKSSPIKIENSYFEVFKAESIDLNINQSAIPAQLSWIPNTFLNCDDCLTPEFNGTEDINYTITFINEDGCINEQMVSVKVLEKKTELIIPNIFSPNGDGINDVWEIKFPNAAQVQDLSIYDRWGNKMFSKKPEVGINNINWDGNMGSTAANPGVYIYSLAYKDDNNKNVVISGDITLIK